MFVRKFFVACLAVTWTWSAFAIDHAGSIRLQTMPRLGEEVDAFPRIISGGSLQARKKINARLAQADVWIRRRAKECGSEGHGSVVRATEVTMTGARYASFLARDNYFCSQAFNQRVPLVFDLLTGSEPDFTRLLPALALKPVQEEQHGRMARTTYASSKLTEFFIAAWNRDNAAEILAGSVDELGPECRAQFAATSLKFILWFNPKDGGVIMEPDNLPWNNAGVCGGEFPIPASALSGSGIAAALLRDIAAGR